MLVQEVGDSVMKYISAVIAVGDIKKSREFYEEILGQKVKIDLGDYVVYEGEFAIMKPFAELLELDRSTVVKRSHNFELYFEVDDFDEFLKRFDKNGDIKYVHGPKKHEWQQRVVRIYDPDDNIIEIGEAIGTIVKRFLEQGLSIEETAAIVQQPLEYVRSMIPDNFAEEGNV